MKSVYIVTTISVKNGNYLNHRAWGWYSHITQATKHVIANVTDIHECEFQYAVIELVPEGILPICIGIDEVVWFKWNGKKYVPIRRKPKELEGIVSWGLG